ncbi:amylo-alpha-1,6-glucosidase [Saccharothrix sp. NRRL B-16314]|uniref:amylo-alpha-1,6-glucosidase n=1 Tax=Saccharothrix sp. NRRL B-16314 TaxID=1463825 RepID=UPI00052687CD|nr:glycogen debranching N-terminal domain-containing protein [Saccharothrix sp. NRRL B-16314]
MTNAWSSGAAPPVTGNGNGSTTLVEGATFCQSSADGDIHPGRPQGLFVSDTRVLSGWRLHLDGAPVELLSTIDSAPYAATFVGRARPRGGLADSTVLVLRRRRVGAGMREQVVLRNLADETAVLMVTVLVEADFADLFEVKEGRARGHDGVEAAAGSDGLTFLCPGAEQCQVVTVTADGEPAIVPRQLTFHAVVPPRDEWSVSLVVQAAIGGVTGNEEHGARSPECRLHAWRMATPQVTTGASGLVTTLATSASDLGALQIHDPRHSERRVVAAGAPWFMALFGRDSLLTSWMALPLDQRLALGTLQTLADHQGRKVDPLTEEQPGRILHEVRLGRAAALALGGGSAYYGTADATPLFVALLGELHRWGLPPADLASLLPSADRALAWIRDFGDRDGDGFVEYQRATDRGLLNQGWKDSFDGVNFADGRMAEPPIALAEVQAYVYAAYTARADIAVASGDERTAAEYRHKAAELKAAFNDRFWLPARGWFALALDAEKRPVDSLTSNMGHCLWCGIVDDDKAGAVAEHLLSPSMWSGFGIRTLADTMGAYNPMSYHNGSVWPHDTAIAAAGLMRYGFVAEAQQVALGVLDAARRFGGRLPELFCGFDRAEFPVPVPYPTSCSPQAWAAAAPILLTRTLLRFQPDLPSGEVLVAPTVPACLVPLKIENLPLAEYRLCVDVREDGWEVRGLPEHLVVTAPDAGR